MKGVCPWCVLLVLLLVPSDVTSSLISGADLGVRVKRTAEEALGSKQIQALYDREADFKINIPEGNKTVDQVAKWLSLYIGELYEVVDNNHDAILRSLAPTPSTESRVKPIILCCDVDASKLPYVIHLGVFGDDKELCVRFATESTDNPTTMRTDLLLSMRKNGQRLPNIGWQYYGTETGVHYSYMSRKTCKPYDPRKRPWYNKARVSTLKDIVIVIDMTQNGDVNLKVKAAQTLLNATSPNDRVAVVAFCRQHHVSDGGPNGNACVSSSLALATGPNLQTFLNFLSTISSQCKDSANYESAISRGFEYFQVSLGSDLERKKVLVLLTDSNPSDAQTPQEIRQVVKEENVHINNQVIIMAYSFGANISNSTEELLKGLAEDTNYTTADGQQHHGRYTNIRSDHNLRYQMHAYFGLFADTKNSSRPIITAPYVDSSGLGLVVSICKSVFHQSNLTGVTCVDVRVEDIFLNSTYYQQGLGAYFFIINSEGRTISHPLLPKPSAILHNPVFVGINILEREREAQTVIKSMKSGGSGYKTFYVSRRWDKGSFSGGHRQVASHYYWRKVENTDFSICLVFTDEDAQLDMSVKNQQPHINYVHPYTLGGYSIADTCINQGTIATTGVTTVRFNGTALTSLPFSRTEKDIARRNANFFSRRANDQGKQFKDNIMDDVEITGRIDPIWQRAPSSSYSYFLKWRYFATLSGIIRVYPGTYFHSFNPNVQPWFQNAAIPYRGQVVLTRIEKEHKHCIMLSTAILMGNPKGRHSDVDLPVAVVAGEFPNAFFYNMLLSIFDACTKEDTVCFLVDDKGYVLVHTAYKDPQGPHCHLISMTFYFIHKEPAIARHLQERGDLEKRRCLDWEKYRVIHSWQLSPSDWVVKSTSPSYELHRVAGTNIFVGITKRTEGRVEPTCGCTNFTECSLHSDCPCYETLTFDYCKNEFSEVRDRVTEDSPTCPIENDVYSPFADLPQDGHQPTKPCFSHSCAEFATESECLPRSVCGWCPGEEDDLTTKCRDANSCPKYSEHDSIPLTQKKKFFFGLVIGISALSICLLLILVICLIRLRLKNKKLNNELLLNVPPALPPGAANPPDPIYHGINEAERISAALQSIGIQANDVPLEQAPPLPITPTSAQMQSSFEQRRGTSSQPSSPRTPNAPEKGNPSPPLAATNSRPSSPRTPNAPQTDNPFARTPNGAAIVDQHLRKKLPAKPPKIPTREDVMHEDVKMHRYVNVASQSETSLEKLSLELPPMERRKPKKGSDDTLVKQVHSGLSSDSGFASRNNGNNENDTSRYVANNKKF